MTDAAWAVRGLLALPRRPARGRCQRSPGESSMPHSRIGSRGASATRNDVIRLLRGDHERLLQEFREFDRLESLQASQACQRVVQRTFAELKVLANVEREVFYPAVHDAIAGTDLIDQ